MCSLIMPLESGWAAAAGAAAGAVQGGGLEREHVLRIPQGHSATTESVQKATQCT